MTTERRPLHWVYLGRQPYDAMVALQERLRGAVRAGTGPEHLLLLEHPPVFTIGRNASDDDIVVDGAWRQRHGITVHPSRRGGKVTYHGPGQLVGYPILDLNPDRRDIRRYVHDLQEVLIRTLAAHGLHGWRHTDPAHIGVWIGPQHLPQKIASLGIHLRRWVTAHGFALNVTTRLDHFEGIVACGLPTVRMTSMAEHRAEAPALPDLAQEVAGHAATIFDRTLVATSLAAVLGPEVAAVAADGG